MTLSTARILTGLYFLLATFFVTWPGLLPFAKMEPFILGLPFSMAWIASWIAGSVVVLYLLDRVERRYRDGGDD
jgi:membrane protein implicated in regulation of membrane protease activity